MTVKFLTRGQDNDLKIGLFLRQHCSSPFISTIKDYFTIPHHLARIDSKYRGINFDAIVYETTGTDLRRESESGEPSSDIPLSMDMRERYIQQVVQAVADLHCIGVVHGGTGTTNLSYRPYTNYLDLHPGNVALPPPTREHIEKFLAKQPLGHEIIRKDGEPTPAHLPRRVIEPENIGYGNGNIKLLDFGYAFQPRDGIAYSRDVFAPGTPPAPEFLRADKKTTQPFKAESWYLGQLVCYSLY